MMLADRILEQDSPSRIDAIASLDARGSRQRAPVVDALSRRRFPAPWVEPGLGGAMRRDVGGRSVNLALQL